MRHRRNLTPIHSVSWVVPISRGLFIQQQKNMIRTEGFQMSFKNKCSEECWQRVCTSTIWWWPCHLKILRIGQKEWKRDKAEKSSSFFFFFQNQILLKFLSFLCSNSTGLWSSFVWLRFQQEHKHAIWTRNEQCTQVNGPCGWLWDLGLGFLGSL